jgi:hypothetical protein
VVVGGATFRVTFSGAVSLALDLSVKVIVPL